MTTAPGRLRIFLAAAVGAEVATEALAFQESISPWASRLRWTHPEDLHVTLKFFGETSTETITRLIGPIAEVAAATALFTVELEGIDFFTPRRKPQILWGRVTTGRDDLVALVSRLDETLEAVGIAREARPFEPHLTLARFSAEAFVGLQVLPRATPFHPAPFPVGAMVLLASDLSAPRGAPRYRVLHSFPLAGTALADFSKEKI